MKHFVIIFLALVVTLAASLYQKSHGPTRPFKTSISIADTTLALVLKRSFDQTLAEVRIPAVGRGTTAKLLYRRYPTLESFDTIEFETEGDEFIAQLPIQPPAAKLSYQIQYITSEQTIVIGKDQPIIVRFRGNVPIGILLPHVLFMFGFMFFSNYAAVLVAVHKKIAYKWILTPLLLLFLGGLVFGPWVQKFAFGAYWTGVPLGWDLTDNKTLIAFIAWLLVAFFYRRSQNAWWIYGAALVTLVIFSIPHSVMGSELNYETGTIETGWFFIPLVLKRPNYINNLFKVSVSSDRRAKRKRTAVFILMISSSLFSYSQELQICGRVIDKHTQMALIGAHIVVPETEQITIAGKDGCFSLPVNNADKVTLEVSYFGYETYRERIAPTTVFPLSITLEEKAIDLNAVTVTSSRTYRLLRDVPELTQIVSSKQIEKIDAVNLKETLELVVPGIDFAPNSHGVNITLNGLSNRYILILVDGERMAGEINGNQDLSQINTASIERIEIVKGAASTMYGSSAIGGVINIITKEPYAGVEATGALQYSKYNTLFDNASVDIRGKQLHSSTRFNSQYSDGYDLTPGTPNNPDGSDIWTQDRYFLGRLEQVIGWEPANRLQLNSKSSFYRRNVYPPKKEGVINPDPTYERFENWGQQLTMNYRFGEKNSVEWAGNFSEYTRFSVYPERVTDVIKVSQNRLLNSRLINNTSISDKQTLIFGAEFTNDHLNDTRTGVDTVSENEWVVFARDELLLGERHRLVGGLRYTWHSAFGSHINPQLSYMLKMPSSNIRLGYSRGFRAPSLKELHMEFEHRYGGLNFQIQGNPDLQPEQSEYFNAAYDMSYGRVYVAASAYYNYIQNIIIEDVSRFQEGYVMYRNQNKANISGFELNTSVRLPYQITLMGSYSYLYAIDENHKQLHNTYRHSAKLNVDYSYQKHHYWLNVNLNGKFIGDKHIDDRNEIEGVFNTYTVPAYFLWKLTLNNRFDYWTKFKFTITYGVDNMFNYINTLDFGSINPGRRFFVSLKFNYKSYK